MVVKAVHVWGEILAEPGEVDVGGETKVHAGSRECALGRVRVDGAQVLLLLAHVSGQHGECVVLKRYHCGGDRLFNNRVCLTLNVTSKEKSSPRVATELRLRRWGQSRLLLSYTATSRK